MSAALGTVARHVMWNRLISIVEEQAQALVRTAFSTSVREAGDLSAGVYDAQGSMLAQAVTGTPGHVNAMADAVPHFIREIGAPNILDGDVYLTNDPWKGTGHRHDITVVTPAFHRAQLVGFFACTAHVVDIGGRGLGADALSVFEEGLAIPIMKFANGGEIDQTLVRLIAENVRTPRAVIGDIHAMVTCNAVGHRRLSQMLTEYGISDLEDIAAFILETAQRATVERIATLPQRAVRGAMRIDGYDNPIDLTVTLTLTSDRVTADFAGTSGLDAHGINVPLVYTKAYACYALKCVIAPDIPNNAGSLAPFQVTAPLNSIVNAQPPAPVCLRHVIGHMIPDAVFAALDVLLPGRIQAEGAGALCNFQVSVRRSDTAASLHDDRPCAERSEVLAFNSGGSGARPMLDGLNATAFPSGVMTMPVEATEHAGAVVVWRKELRPDSGGAGTFRGGLGQTIEVEARNGHNFDFSAMFDRVHHPARGRAGGDNGAVSVLRLKDGTPLKAKGRQPIPHGGCVVLDCPGGGGFGPAAHRAREAVRRDLARGYITEAAARSVYGLSEEDISAVQKAVAAGEDV